MGVIGRQIRSTTSKTDADRCAHNDHRLSLQAQGQLVSVNGVMMTSCNADSGGTCAANTITLATVAGVFGVGPLRPGIPLSPKTSKKWGFHPPCLIGL